MTVARKLWRDLCWVCGTDPGWLELWSSTMLIYWGILLLFPIDVFAASPSYIFMSRIAAEDTWGIGFFLIGSSQLYAMARRRKEFLWVGDVLAGAIWVGTAIMFWKSNPWTLAPAYCSSMAGAMAYAVWYRTDHG